MEEARELQVQIAKSFEEEASSRESGIAKTFFYNKALSLYSNIGGFTKKMQELKSKISQSLQQAEEKQEFKEILFKMPLPVEEFIKNYVNKLQGKKPEEILRFLMDDESLIPKKENIRQDIQENANQYPLQFLIPTQVYGRYGPIRTLSEPNEIFEYKVKERFNMESEIKEIFLCRLLERLLKDKLKIEDILGFLKNGDNITKNCYKIIEAGINEHFKRNYIASVHILVPQIEEILRTLLQNHGVTPASYETKEQVIEEKLLRGLIDESEIFVGENFAEYLRVRLLTEFANIRNKVCHGWMQSEEFTEMLSNALIYMILRLSKK